MCRISVPISHLFKNPEIAKSIIKESECLEAREHSIGIYSKLTEAFHFDIQPIHTLDESIFNYLVSIKQREKQLKLISFHMASSCDKPTIDNGVFLPGGKRYSENELLDNANQNLKRIRDIFGKDISIAVENNNYYQTDAYQYVTDAAFIKRIVNDNDIYILFDMAHAKVTACNKGIEYSVYRDHLPLGKMVQLHVSGFTINKNGKAFDSHNYPDESDLLEVRYLLDTYKIQYITPEYYKDVKGLLNLISQIKDIVN